MSDSFIGSNVSEVIPEYVNYLFKQFSKDLQGKIVRYLYNTKVRVNPLPEDDSVEVVITHKLFDIVYTQILPDINKAIQEEAKNDGIVKDLAKSVIAEYRNEIWHMFFFDFKSKKNKKAEETAIESPEPQKDDTEPTIEDKIEQKYSDGLSVEQIAQQLDISKELVYTTLQMHEAINNG